MRKSTEKTAECRKLTKLTLSNSFRLNSTTCSTSPSTTTATAPLTILTTSTIKQQRPLKRASTRSYPPATPTPNTKGRRPAHRRPNRLLAGSSPAITTTIPMTTLPSNHSDDPRPNQRRTRLRQQGPPPLLPKSNKDTAGRRLPLPRDSARPRKNLLQRENRKVLLFTDRNPPSNNLTPSAILGLRLTKTKVLVRCSANRRPLTGRKTDQTTNPTSDPNRNRRKDQRRRQLQTDLHSTTTKKTRHSKSK